MLTTVNHLHFVFSGELVIGLLVKNNCHPVVDCTDKEDQHGSLVLNVLKICDLLVKIDYLLWTSVD